MFNLTESLQLSEYIINMAFQPNQVDKGEAWVVLLSVVLLVVLAAFLYSECYSTTSIFYVKYTQMYEVSQALAAWVAGLMMVTQIIGSK